ncbi:hypothetical protein BVRB_1g009440 [Beta vulgaris subsp. vulgaris]|nr:hypothetical protein BVRB_1g009440 [Beta vulgaris subsp. vulgaris]
MESNDSNFESVETEKLDQESLVWTIFGSSDNEC